MSKPDVWFPLVVGDYLKDTSRLTTEQHGAYLLLLMDYWVNGPPVDDDTALAAITRLDARRWKANRPSLLRFFRIVDGAWRQKRIDQELERWTEKKRNYVERASAGGRAKAAKSTATSTTKALLKSCSSSSSTEVDGPTGQSTLCGEGSKFDLEGRRADQPESERDWAIAVKQAENDELKCRRSDPDHASELAEFIDFAKDRIATLRRARLSLVAA